MVERLAVRFRAAALREGILAGSSEEVERLAPALIELAVLPVFEGGRSAVRGISQKCLWFLGLRTGEARSADALREVARCWLKLPDLARRTALAVGRGRWAGAVEGVNTDPNPLIRAGVAELALDAGDAELAPVCVEMLSDTDPQVALRAERALLGLSLRAVGVRAAGGTGDAEGAVLPGLGASELIEGRADRVFESVAAGCRRFGEHRRRGVLLAALALLDRIAIRFGGRGPGDGRALLANWFHQPDGESLGALRSVLASTRLPLARVRALEWLAVPQLADACVRRLAFTRSVAEHGEVLAAAHLLCRPARAGKVAKLPLLGKIKGRGTAAERVVLPPNSPAPSPGEYGLLSLGARRGLPRFMRAIGADPRVLRTVLGSAIADGDIVARHAACRVMPLGGLGEFCLDRDARVSRTAALRWSRAGSVDSTAGRADAAGVSALARSAEPFLRRIAEEESQLDASPGAGTVRGRVAARRGLLADSGGLLRDIEADLSDQNDLRRVNAIMLIRRLSLTERFEGLLAVIVEEGSPRAAATAVAALASLRTERAARALARCARSSEARVRANAADALTHRHVGESPGVLIELKDDPHHRVRANVLRGAMGSGVAGLPADRAGLILADMLADSRASHRLAGVWVASRALPGAGRARLGQRWAELAARVVELARTDADASVRGRSAACALRLDAEVRAAWRQNVPWQRLSPAQGAGA
ncbi:hypothetical protein PHYC_00491 [Phycisphaerales bacterium]|nr:hypothetical protein PHYC_00491 [Phycisphaerales bacterium]